MDFKKVQKDGLYYFEDENDNRIYKDVVSLDDSSRKEILKQNDLQIVEASELFDMFYNVNPIQNNDSYCNLC